MSEGPLPPSFCSLNLTSSWAKVTEKPKDEGLWFWGRLRGCTTHPCELLSPSVSSSSHPGTRLRSNFRWPLPTSLWTAVIYKKAINTLCTGVRQPAGYWKATSVPGEVLWRVPISPLILRCHSPAAEPSRPARHRGPPPSTCVLILILKHPTDAACKCTEWFKLVFSVCKCSVLWLLRGTLNICSLISDIFQSFKQGGYSQRRHVWGCCAAPSLLPPRGAHPEPALGESGFKPLNERFFFLDVCMSGGDGGDTRGGMQIPCELSRKAHFQSFSCSKVFYSGGFVWK